jgi:uncharacterized protein (UPF0333 family)
MRKHAQPKKRSRGERGLAMILTLFLVVVSFSIVVAVLASSMNSAAGSLSVQTKNQTFNAAETGLHAAIYQIDANNSISSGSQGTGTVDGYTYNWEVVQNQLGKTSTTVNDVDSAYTSSISLAANQAYIEGWASSITGGRTVYAEAIVVAGPPVSFTGGAVVSGQTAQISHQQITDISGKHSANIHAQQITESGGGQTPDGNTYATCNTVGCNAITGLDGQEHINQAPPTFLTASQLAAIQSSALSAAQSGGSNVYVNGNWTGTGTWGTAGSNCTVYVNGNVTLSGSGTLTNNCTTTVVTGNLTMSGNVQYAIAPSTTTHAMYVLGSGGVTFNGTTNTAGFVYAANGPVTLNGGGHGSFTGVLYSPYTVTMNGGGGATFNYDPIQSQVTAPNPNVVPVAQWEY